MHSDRVPALTESLLNRSVVNRGDNIWGSSQHALNVSPLSLTASSGLHMLREYKEIVATKRFCRYNS